ncbi:hypothetical protein B0T24DRAFT_706869 [Lasiosphaeria ovina]|uniref:CN hydrolase domain-containing protein n=1 Tax=Lasiosphaeria ovina TaxID=92902 RepID=A0AAE0N5U2_9PEZI|nr:hypothetical protein B0T24DRAFT_706869 [Lasiosphaeria ovina]
MPSWSRYLLSSCIWISLGSVDGDSDNGGLVSAPPSYVGGCPSGASSSFTPELPAGTFAPQVGNVDNNLNRADAILSRFSPESLNLLILPELAFSGYNFKSLQQITPFLEYPGSGISSLWARTTALKYDCAVVVGYPEKVDVTPSWSASPECYNSAFIVNGNGETIGNAALGISMDLKQARIRAYSSPPFFTPTLPPVPPSATPTLSNSPPVSALALSSSGEDHQHPAAVLADLVMLVVV